MQICYLHINNFNEQGRKFSSDPYLLQDLIEAQAIIPSFHHSIFLNMN
jgi:hypothetical protein